MKKAYKLLFALTSLLVVSCGDVEPVIYNGDIDQNNTFLSFSKSVYTLPIVRDNNGSVELVLQSSTVSSVDRTYNLAIDTEASTANPDSYVFPATITIPAGSYTGTAMVTGVDEGVTSDIKTVVFSISNITEENQDVEEIILNVVEVCPLEDDFTGTYTISQSGGISGIPVLTGNTTVELIATGEFERQFTINDIYIDGANIPAVVTFNLSCNQTFLAENVDTTVYCGDNPDNTIIWGMAQAGNEGSYTFDDDSIIEVSITEDINASCETAQTTFTLTKVE